MVFFNIFFMGRTENVQMVFLSQNNVWHIKIKCSGCDQAFPKQVTFSKLDTVEMEKHHGEANFTIKCKQCERKGHIRIDNSSLYQAVPNEDGIIKQMIAVMQCRGIEIVSISLGNMFNVKVKDSPTIFQSVDFTDLWCQYDEEIDKVAQVEDPRIQIVRSK